MSILSQITKMGFQKTTLIKKEKISSEFYHIKVQSEALKDIDYTPGQHLKLYVGHDEPGIIKGKARSYSIWNYDKNNLTFDIAVNTLSNGVGAEWVKNLNENDAIYFFGPKGSLTIDSSYDNHYFFGDITTLAHFYAIKRNLSPDKKVFSVIYASSEDQFFPDLVKENTFDLKVLDTIEEIMQQVKALPYSENQKNVLYIGGEEKVCHIISNYFQKEKNLDRKDIKLKSFWDSER